MSMKSFLFLSLKKKSVASASLTLEKRLGYKFKNCRLKEQALTHKSLAMEKKNDFHNERLEFLGDAVFDLCVSDLLMEHYPKASEGDLSKMRATVVNTHYLSELAGQLKLDQDLKLGVGESKDQGRLKPRLLACVLEAIIGAVYLDGGYRNCQKLVKSLVEAEIKKGLVNKDYKSILQEYIQKKFQKIPIYDIVNITGPEHERVFVMEVKIGNQLLGRGKGQSKKKAAQSAALDALKKLDLLSSTQLQGK